MTNRIAMVAILLAGFGTGEAAAQQSVTCQGRIAAVGYRVVADWTSNSMYHLTVRNASPIRLQFDVDTLGNAPLEFGLAYRPGQVLNAGQTLEVPIGYGPASKLNTMLIAVIFDDAIPPAARPWLRIRNGRTV